MTATLPTTTLLERIPRLAAQFSARARETEALRTLPADLAADVKAAGLFRMATPAALGGLELEPATVIEIFEELSRADSSAGWCTIIGNATAFFAWLEPCPDRSPRWAGSLATGSADAGRSSADAGTPTGSSRVVS